LYLYRGRTDAKVSTEISKHFIDLRTDVINMAFYFKSCLIVRPRYLASNDSSG